MADQKENQLNIELSEEVAEGTYSNLTLITHSQSEFVMDFIRLMPGVPKARVKSRVVMSPQNAKRLMKALADNISKYEAQNGIIKDDGGNPAAAFPLNFGGPATEA